MVDPVQEHQWAVLQVPNGGIQGETGARTLTDAEGRAYAIDWKAWPAAFYVRLPNVSGDEHGFDFAAGSIEVLKKDDEPGVYYGENNDGSTAYTPFKSTLQLCYFGKTGHLGWLFTWGCRHMTHLQCLRVVDLGAGDGLSPVGNYYAYDAAAGQLVLAPPYSVSATP